MNCNFNLTILTIFVFEYIHGYTSLNVTVLSFISMPVLSKRMQSLFRFVKIHKFYYNY